MGCSDDKGDLFVVFAEACEEAGNKQTITYRVGTWGDYLESKCEFIVTADPD